MTWLLAAVGTFVALGVVIVAFGATLPREHAATVRIRLASSPSAVWTIINDPVGAASWRNDVKSIDALPDRDGRRAWREHSRNGVITFVLAESRPEQRMVTQIDDDSLPFGGQWEYTLDRSGNTTVLTVTERGVVKPALFRFMSRYVFGYTSTMQGYLSALANRLGENVQPEIVAPGR